MNSPDIVVKEYTLNIEKSNPYQSDCQWKLSLTEEEISKIIYMREVTEESMRKLGSPNEGGLDISLSTTYSFRPVDPKFYEKLYVYSSRISYIGNNKYVVEVDLDKNYSLDYLCTEEFEL